MRLAWARALRAGPAAPYDRFLPDGAADQSGHKFKALVAAARRAGVSARGPVPVRALAAERWNRCLLCTAWPVEGRRGRGNRSPWPAARRSRFGKSRLELERRALSIAGNRGDEER